ncbi:MAG: aminotransferase class IV [Akkermansiaceae bacterium]|jgi:branched-chain amino acid aminotransferase
MLQRYHPANADLIVNINGRLVHRDEAGVSPFDSSVQNGDAVWEGLRLYQGRIFKLQEHLDRLRRSAQLLRYDGMPDDELLIDEIRKTLAANQMTDGVHLRLTVSRGVKYTSGLDPRVNTNGCSFFILAEHKPPVYDKTGLVFRTVSIRRPFANILNQHIHSCNQLTSILAKMEATDAGADDALMLDTEGNLAETNATHVFLVRNGVVETSTTKACPEGITRMTVLELCRENGIPTEVRDIPEDEIHTVDEVFCTGTMGEIAPVVRIDDTVFGKGVVGPMTSRISKLFGKLTSDEGVGVC